MVMLFKPSAAIWSQELVWLTFALTRKPILEPLNVTSMGSQVADTEYAPCVLKVPLTS